MHAGTAIRAKRDIIERIGPATSRIAGLPSISWRCAPRSASVAASRPSPAPATCRPGALSGLLHTVQQNLFQPRLERDHRQLRLKPDNALHDCAGQRDANRGDHRAGILTRGATLAMASAMVRMSRTGTCSWSSACRTLSRVDREISPGTSSSASFGELRASNCRSCCTLHGPAARGRACAAPGSGEWRPRCSHPPRCSPATAPGRAGRARSIPPPGRRPGPAGDAAEAAEYLAGVDRQLAIGIDLRFGHADPHQGQTVGVGQQVEVVADVHRGHQEAQLLGQLLRTP